MLRIICFVALVFISSCCSPYCSMNEFAKTSRTLFATQFQESLENTPKTARHIGTILLGDTKSFVRSAGIAWDVAKGDFQGIQVVGRAVKEQWNESIASLPQYAKTLARYSCLYCGKEK